MGTKSRSNTLTRVAKSSLLINNLRDYTRYFKFYFKIKPFTLKQIEKNSLKQKKKSRITPPLAKKLLFTTFFSTCVSELPCARTLTHLMCFLLLLPLLLILLLPRVSEQKDALSRFVVEHCICRT